MNYQLSASILNILTDCERCFWLHVKKGIQRPKSIFPSLPGGMDKVLKKYFDSYRSRNDMPDEIKKELPNMKLWQDQKDMDRWRDWRSGLTYTSPTGIKLIGALDDLVTDKNYVVSPFDYKTRGYPPKSLIDSQKYYGLQLSIYSLLLQQNNFNISGVGYLLYYYPEKVETRGVVRFGIELVRISADPQLAVDSCLRAIELLKSDKPPAPSPVCECCGYLEKML